MVRRLALAALGAALVMAFVVAPATAGTTATKMRFELGSRDGAARSLSGSVSLWVKAGSSWMPVGGAPLAVIVDNRQVATVTTDAGGFAVVSMPADLSPGGHVMKVVYTGNGVYSKSQRSQGFTVTDSPTTGTVPDAPFLSEADVNVGSITLIWVPPANDGGSPITGYNIYRGPDLRGSVSGSETTYVDAPTTSGEFYVYYVTAVNANGESLPSNEIFVFG
jgi:hypothetical protein